MRKIIPQQMVEAEAKRLEQEKQGIKKPTRKHPWEQPGYPQYDKHGHPLHDQKTSTKNNFGNGSRSYKSLN